LLARIGKGSFGNVYKARFKRNSKVYALKQQSKAKLMKDSNLKYALGENKILRNTYCPFLINMHYAFQVLSARKPLLSLRRIKISIL
jgi:serum/glucocorticoid-regulated kinase 2